MTTTNHTYQAVRQYFVLIVALLSSVYAVSQQTPIPQDSTKTGHSFGNMTMPNPNSIESKYTYDPFTDRYIYTETVGNFNINYPIILTPEEYQDFVLRESLKAYYKEKVDAYDGKKEGTEEEQKNLLPEFYVRSGLFETIFGGNTINVVPQGSVEMDLGVLFTKQDNPTFSPRNRRNFTFDFDQRISLSLLGKVGTRLQVTANYDTESTFDFQNLIKLEYTPTEDDIIQKIEVGNVNMPLNSSLISGAQSLFGVKTQLKFGKTTITGVFSEQKSDTRTVVAQGGGTLEEFEFYVRDYDENRHYFLAHYFRDNYDKSLENYPYISNNIQITRIEVWVTNRNNTTENVRNVVALQDLGESNTDPTENNFYLQPVPGGFVTAGPNAYPDNGNNRYNPVTIGSGSVLTEAIRDIATAHQGFGTLSGSVNEGSDFGKLENARKLQEGREFTLHPQLGYISLNQRLANDEILAVAYQYTVGGQVYQVGEFANDGIDATAVDNTSAIEIVTNNSLVLKMLKAPVTNVDQPIWDLMMKNIYDTGAYQLSQEDFKLNIFYNEASPLNFITPVSGTPFPAFNGNAMQETTLLKLFHLDRLNYNNDPQANGDGFFDYVPRITVTPQNGKIIFTKVEPFGEYLFDVLSLNNAESYLNTTTYNDNQTKYVYDVLYKETKTAALEAAEKNKFLLKGRYKSTGSDGIPIGAFNVPRGSVTVTAGGRVLVEGIDYTVNYSLGTVQILDEALKASNTPIQVSTENNAVFGQQTKRFTGINVEHKFNENFVLGATWLNLNERPITQKANYSQEPINNHIFGINGNYSTEVPFLTRLVNKLPNIDTDAPSNISVRGEFAYLAPGQPKGTDFNSEPTSYVDDFEGSQNAIDLKSPQSWFISSRPRNLGRTYGQGNEDDNGIQNGFDRALLNWYNIDPIFYGNRKPSDISDDDISTLYTSRVFSEELFPNQDIAQGQSAVINTLDLVYYPEERGPYNFQTTNVDPSTNTLTSPQNSWAGITRAITSTDFEQANVEYIEFWLQDPFQDNPANSGGKLVFNLGNISEDVIKDGRKVYENGLPQDGNVVGVLPTSPSWETVYPQNQSLIYAFDTTGQERTNQDVGYDGYSDNEERQIFTDYAGLNDPARDNYTYFLNTSGDIFERYRQYNGVDGNSPDTFSDTNRGSTTQPDVEDINRDNTMNTIDSYFEYEIDVTPATLNENNPLIADVKASQPRNLPNGQTLTPRWYQFRIPVTEFTDAIGGINDLRSVRFARLYLKEFTETTVFRFGTLDLVRSDWRRYTQTLEENDPNPDDDNTEFSVGVVSTIENEGSYESPPGVEPEELYNNNTVVRQNEQSLLVNVCDLEPQDARAVFKNINVDMRQYKKLRMFMHAEEGETAGLVDDDLVGFIRMGNDLTQNYYQIEIPLKVSPSGTRNRTLLWPVENEISLPLSLLQDIKAKAISDGALSSPTPTFYDVNGEGLSSMPVAEFAALPPAASRDRFHRVGIKGNPNFGDIRTLMIGVKNRASSNKCAKLWYNELRLSDMDNEGGWAAILSMDSNIADFANISATGRKSTTGFGTLEQGPNERSREDVVQYDVVTNVNLGQLLPKKWGMQIPFNYGQGEELITPKYDEYYKDLTLESRIDAANTDAEAEQIREQSENYTKRRSINFIGVRKVKTGDSKPRFYDVENLTFNYSYNKVKHRDFEIENAIDQSVRAGVNYAYNFEPISIEPFKKNDSLFTGKYWKILKDFNINPLPASFTVNTDINRQYNKQRFRDTDLTGQNIGLDDFFRRNYTFDYQYAINYNLTKSLQVNFSASNNNIVRNYFKNDIVVNGEQDPTLDVWDGFFDFGDPNRQYQQLGVNYQLPINKIPVFSFVDATYSYSGEFQWQKGPDLEVEGYSIGHSISNANQHNINASLNMSKLYNFIGLKKKRVARRGSGPTRKISAPSQDNERGNAQKAKKDGSGIVNFGIGLLTSLKRMQINYAETNGTYLPGYLRTPGFIGTMKPTVGFTFGSQSDVRQLAARNGWLTLYPDFNEQYTINRNKQLDFSANLEPIGDLKIDLVGNRIMAENYTENYRVDDINGDLEYQSLTPNTFGNFNISTALIKTAFSSSDEKASEAFQTFRDNRLEIANRLAERHYGTSSFPVNPEDGYPVGFGKGSQAVLLPAFLSAYTGTDAGKISLKAFRDVPIPNWDIKYTGLMKVKWFKDRFKRFSLTHGYRSNYTINQFRSNLNYNDQNPSELDQGGNFKSKMLYSNISLTEMFSPLVRIDMEMNNSIKILAELKKDRMLSLSFDNNLMTEIQGMEYILGLGYRVKDVRIKSKLAGPRKMIVSDLNLKADVSLRENKTIIRYLDLDNNQVTSGQTMWSAKFTADYAFSKNLMGIFFFDYAFSEYAISTAFPQTSIRGGITLRYNFGN
ncbi:SprA protein [Mangrovimonas yunxiaonensis]|uniref:SprA protein n=1 Tax=Mangrovimonas yunxiaonensis TaxID=1197477 RepID=A0A084TME4_9FLAO|nr:cell surface protein SprA [Mangrovimonas yunxiaonensis]KFB01880.1 SprA protein [Mangrovimonas yunxiaonensis]